MSGLRKLMSWIIIAFTLLSMIIRFFTDNFNIPYAFVTILDVIAILILIASVVINFDYVLNHRRIYILFLVLLLGLFITNIAGGFNACNLLIGIRPYIRLFVILLSTVTIFTIREVNIFIKLFFYLAIFNFLFSMFQFFVLDLKQDYVGGIFGNTAGCNSAQNVFWCIDIIIYLTLFFAKKCSLKKLLLSVGMAMAVAVISELTVFFVEFAIIVFVCCLINYKKNKRIVFITGVAFALFLLVGIALYMIVFPERMFLLSIENVLNYLGINGSGVYKISRLRPYSQIENIFFDNNLKKAFGFGAGNCSSITTFYTQYHGTYQYTWFTVALVIFENGLFGLILLALLLAIYLFYNLSQKNKSNFVNQIGILMSCLIIILAVYNSSLFDVYTSYIIGMVMAFSLISEKEVRRIEDYEGRVE